MMIKSKAFYLLFFVLLCASCGLPLRRQVPSAYQNRLEWEQFLRKVEFNNRTLQAKQLINQIRMYLGVPYRYNGESMTGMDCSGFVSTVFKKSLHIDLPRNTESMSDQAKPVPIPYLRLGDLIFFEIIHGRGISHVGIYLDENIFAHASAEKGVTLADLSQDYYKSRYKSARRLIQLR